MVKLSQLIYPALIILLFSLLFFFKLGATTVIDYDEGVYAEVSKEMFLNKTFILPTLNGKDFFEKPPMLYWAQLAGYQIFGINSLGARMFNTLGGLATLLIIFVSARGPLGNKTAFNSVLILGSSLVYVYLSRVAMTDMFLTLFLTICLVSFWSGVERELDGRDGHIFFWWSCFAAGCAMLSKGVIGALFPIVTALIYLLLLNKIGLLFKKKWFFPGTVILVLVGFSWYLMLGFLHPEGFEFMKDLFLKHHVGRFSSVMEGHSGPIYFYLIVLLVGFLPWFSYLPLSAIHAPLTPNREQGARYLRLFVIFSVIVFLFFSISATKLPNYILPSLPGLALITAVLFAREHIKYRILWRACGWVSAVLMALIGLVLAFSPVIISYLPDLLGEDSRKAPILLEHVQLGVGVWLAAAIFFVCSFLLLRSTHGNRISSIFQTLLLCSFLTSATTFLIIMPTYDRLMNTPLVQLAQEAADLTSPGEPIVMYNVSDRPSVMFVSDRPTLYHSDRNREQLFALFREKELSVGITTSYYFDRLISHSIPAVDIKRAGGFVLFKMVSDAPDTPLIPPEMPTQQ